MVSAAFTAINVISDGLILWQMHMREKYFQKNEY